MTSFLSTLKKWFLILVPVFILLFIIFTNWSFFFKKKIIGEIVAVERVTGPIAVLTDSQKAMSSQIFSFSVAIKDRQTGEIHMASSEDRQWAAVTKGNCVIAAFFPYPPWILDKGMTSHNARLLRNFTSCDQLPDDKGFFESLKFFFMLAN